MTAVSRILSPAPVSEKLRLDNDHLSSSPSFAGDAAKIDIFARKTGAGRSELASAVVRRYPRINPERVYGPAILPLFCLAPHGVFPASRITPRAVSSYLAFSPLPALLSKNRRCLFCDTFRQRPLSRMLPAYFTRHAAVWCSDFPPANLAIHQRSSAIGGEFITIRNAGKQEVGTEPARKKWVQRHAAFL